MNSEVALHALLSARGDSGPARAHPFETKSCSESPRKIDGVSDVRRDGGDCAVLSAVMAGVALVGARLLMMSGSAAGSPGAFCRPNLRREAAPVQPGARRSARTQTSDSTG